MTQNLDRCNLPKLRVLSLGAGVQSTTLALMAAHDKIARPDCAIFADTGGEPAHVYKHLAWLQQTLPYPVHVVSRGNLAEDCLRNARGEVKTGHTPTLPAYATSVSGGGPLARHCTRDYKIEPIHNKIRELIGLKPRQKGPKSVAVEQWVGISTDEAHRMKPVKQAWIETRWPLIERRMSRWDCLRWLERNHYPHPGKSACMFCPYHNDDMWRQMRDHDPTSWAYAISFDNAIRNGFKGSREKLFLHRSLKPLEEVDLSVDDRQLDLFGNECEGMCGV